MKITKTFILLMLLKMFLLILLALVVGFFVERCIEKINNKQEPRNTYDLYYEYDVYYHYNESHLVSIDTIPVDTIGVICED